MYKHQMQGRGVARTQADLLVGSRRGPPEGTGRQPRRAGDLHRRLRRRATPRKVTNTRDAEHHADLVARRPGRSPTPATGPPAAWGRSRTSCCPTSRPASGQRRRTAIPSKQNYLPIWSPDGSKLAFTTQPGRQPRDLRDEQGRQRRAADDQQPGDRRLADVVADRRPDRVGVGPHRHADGSTS